jgi:hypothetical protein
MMRGKYEEGPSMVALVPIQGHFDDVCADLIIIPSHKHDELLVLKEDMTNTA